MSKWYATDMKNPWKTLSSEYVHENPWFKVRHDKLVRPDGDPGEYYVIEGRGGAFIIALDEQERITLVRQTRYANATDSWEVPAGGIDHNEQPLVTAKRELAEETGLQAKHWKKLGKLQSNGSSSAFLHIYLATGLSKSSGNAQAQEGITEMDTFTAPEVVAMIQGGKITDSQTLAALLLHIASQSPVGANA